MIGKAAADADEDWLALKRMSKDDGDGPRASVLKIINRKVVRTTKITV